MVGTDVSREDVKRWLAQTNRVVETLKRLYFVLVPALAEGVKAIEAAVPVALLGGE